MGTRKSSFWLLYSTLPLLIASCSSLSKTGTALQESIKSSDDRKQLTLPSEIVTGGNSRSKYEGLRTLFASGVAPPASHFSKDAVLVGKCAFRDRSQQFFFDRANVYVEDDFVLGKMIYFIPQLVGLPTVSGVPSASFPTIPQFQARDWHRNGMGEKKYFSPLQFTYPKNSPFYDLTVHTLGGAAHLYYSKPSQGIPMKSQFRVRLAQIREKESVLAVEHLCPYFMGCRFKNAFGETRSEMHYQHLEAYAYCYYAKGYEFTSPPRTERVLSSVPNSPPVLTRRTAEEVKNFEFSPE